MLSYRAAVRYDMGYEDRFPADARAIAKEGGTGGPRKFTPLRACHKAAKWRRLRVHIPPVSCKLFRSLSLLQ